MILSKRVAFYTSSVKISGRFIVYLYFFFSFKKSYRVAIDLYLELWTSISQNGVYMNLELWKFVKNPIFVLEWSNFWKTLFIMSTIRICNNTKIDFSDLMSKPVVRSHLFSAILMQYCGKSENDRTIRSCIRVYIQKMKKK